MATPRLVLTNFRKRMHYRQEGWFRFLTWISASPSTERIYAPSPPIFSPSAKDASIIHAEWNKKKGKGPSTPITIFVCVCVTLSYPDEINKSNMKRKRRDSVAQADPWGRDPLSDESLWLSGSGVYLNDDRHVPKRYLMNVSWTRMNLRRFITT